jgi:hypothetical protein
LSFYAKWHRGILLKTPGATLIRSIVGLFVAAFLVMPGFAVGPARSQSAGADLIQLAQGSTCKSWFNNCAARCRKDNPQDRNCPSDHCSPKLADCKANGCWQEGNRYGGGRTCNLKRG